MATRRTADFKAYTALVRAQLSGKLLQGAGRAMGKVIAEDAKRRVSSKRVAGSIKVASRVRDGRIIVRIETRGPGAFLAPWLEHGTEPHFITASADLRGGRTVRRLNEQLRQGSLKIGGKFVGETVFHPGIVNPEPFLRPALDTAFDDALRAGQAYITTRLGKAGASLIESDDE
ncbi:HK97 gp10 family phage protein [uncultured Sphingomonas sp.]|uniref:HK97 gp10 family phage protein n=1 Tax=uncultured Sphingomonas sp. TaxID=158754 RepID=UPI0025F8AC68|nr:HK97 gp10 family phage protein [uncultured Sphingomonas sp.]